MKIEHFISPSLAQVQWKIFNKSSQAKRLLIRDGDLQKKVYDIESWILKKNIICIMILASIMRHIIYSSYIIIQCVFLISLNAPFEKRIIILFHKKVWKRNLIYSIILGYVYIDVALFVKQLQYIICNISSTVYCQM